MTSPTALTDVVSGPASAIGRYFSVLSVPSALFTTYLYALLASGAASGRPPDWEASALALGDLGLQDIALLGLVSLLLGLVLQPLQYSIVQFLEGYWGVGGAAQKARVRRIAHHRRQYRALVDREETSFSALEDLGRSPGDASAPAAADEHIPLLSEYHEASRALTGYPDRLNDIRPTRLGNVLRRYEARAGRAYGLPGVSVVPHLSLVAPERDVAYLDDQRTQLDLAVRLAMLSAVATIVTVAVLWRSGGWLLLALVPYATAFAFYRGAVGQAHAYGTAVITLIDLNRFGLYERLGLPRPTSLSAEHNVNAELAMVLRDHEPADVAL